MRHASIEACPGGGAVAIAPNGDRTQLQQPEDFARWVALIEERCSWITVWSTGLIHVVRWVWVERTGPYSERWRDLPVDLVDPSINRSLQMTASMLSIRGRRMRIVLRDLSGWVDGGRDSLAPDYGQTNTPEGRARALVDWQRETEAALVPLGGAQVGGMRGSGSSMAYKLWSELWKPRTARWMREHAGAGAPCRMPPDTVHPDRPGVHSPVTYERADLCDGAGARAMSVWPCPPTVIDGDEWIHGNRLATRGAPDWIGSGHLIDGAVDVEAEREIADPVSAIGAEWMRHRAAMRPGRAQGIRGWYRAPGVDAGIQEAAAVKAPGRDIPPGHDLWHIDIGWAYPGAMMGIMPWPYAWKTEPDYRHARDGGPVSGVARVRLRLPSSGAPVVGVRSRSVCSDHGYMDDWGTGSGLVWPVGGEIIDTLSIDTIRTVLDRGGAVVETRWYRGMMDGWDPFSRFIRATYAVAADQRRAHVTAAIKRIPTRLYGRLGMGRRRTVAVRLADAIAEGLRPVMVLGDRAFVRRDQAEPPNSAMPVYAARIEARVCAQLAEAEDDVRAWADRSCRYPLVGVDTDGMLICARDDGHGRPDVPLDWGTDPGQWRVKARAPVAVYGRPKLWTLISGDGERLIERASGVPERRRAMLWSRGADGADTEVRT